MVAKTKSSSEPHDLDADRSVPGVCLPCTLPGSADPISAARSVALAYAALGYHVFPCRADKKPFTERGFHDASTDPQQVVAWWRRWPDAQIGIACGASGIVVVDCDIGDGKNGIAAFAEHCGMDPHGATLVARTPRGGRHYVYADPEQRFGICQNAGSLPGIDVRGSGGYIVVPSSSSPDREWLEGEPGDDLAPPPEHVIVLLPPRRGSTGPHAHGRMTPAGTATDDRFAEVQSALFAIDPGVTRLGGWLQAIFAVHAALDADERGADLVETWSSKTTVPGQYKAGEAWGTYAAAVLPWNMRKGGQAVDAETLFFLARERGWTWTSADRTHAELQAAIGSATREPTSTASVDNQTKEPEPLPSHLIEGGDLVALMTRHVVETAIVPQPALALGAVLATLGAVMARCVQLRGGGGSPARTNIYTINVGDTSSGKNHPRTCCPALLVKCGMPDLVGPREYMSGSGVFATLQTYPAHVAFIDEFGLILQGTTGKQAPPHLRSIATALLTLFSSAATTVAGAAYANQRENPMAPIVEPCLSLAGFTTPETLVAALSSKNIADGLLGRCLLFPADPTIRKRRGLYHRAAAEAAGAVSGESVVDRLKALRAVVAPQDLPDCGGEAGARCRDVFWSSEAANYIDDVLLPREEERRAGPRFGKIWARLVEHVSKVALVHAVATDPSCDEIGIVHLRWAETLVTWCMTRLERLLSEHLADSEFEANTQRVLQILRGAKTDGLTATVLTRRTRWLTRNERKDVVMTLIEAEQVTATSTPAARADGKGKPTTTYYATEFAPQ